MRIDVFCRVVDNYGDAGVTWRLARQLAAEHGAAMTLWIDAPQALACLAPGLDTQADVALRDGVHVRKLDDDASAPATLPDVVVEGFGCGLPARYLQAMADAAARPVWVNLEYLSAEAWIETVHGLPSPHPRLPLTRHFFFPGFTRATGGLLRERDLLVRRDRTRAAAQRGLCLRFPPPVVRALAAAQADAAAEAAPAGRCVVSLFCYANAALGGLLDAWSEGDEPMLCLVPEGVATASFDAWLGGGVPHAGQRFDRGALTLATIPFLSQDDYDTVLLGCDVNFVRGEDSFVRAQWAAQPFAWHVYPQADDAHRIKLEAFLDRYLADAPAAEALVARTFWRAWNDADPGAVAAAWPPFRQRARSLAQHNARWSARLSCLPDLAGSLLEFCRNRL